MYDCTCRLSYMKLIMIVHQGFFFLFFKFIKDPIYMYSFGYTCTFMVVLQGGVQGKGGFAVSSVRRCDGPGLALVHVVAGGRDDDLFAYLPVHLGL